MQAEKSVEALLLYLAVLRAGYVYLPLNTAYKSDELSYFLGNAEPSVLVCAPKDFAWLSQARLRGRHRATCSRLGGDRSGSLLERAAHFRDTHAAGRSAAATTSPPSSTPAAPPGAARARC